MVRKKSLHRSTTNDWHKRKCGSEPHKVDIITACFCGPYPFAGELVTKAYYLRHFCQRSRTRLQGRPGTQLAQKPKVGSNRWWGRGANTEAQATTDQKADTKQRWSSQAANLSELWPLCILRATETARIGSEVGPPSETRWKLALIQSIQSAFSKGLNRLTLFS